MANELVKKSLGSTAVTALDDNLASRMLAGIEDSQATTQVAGGGLDLIKLDKGSGTWGIGQADEPVQEGSSWFINLMSICHGFVCWSDYKGTRKNERLGEIMGPMFEPKPAKPNPIDGFPFTEQRSFEAICLDGEDAGRKVQFKNGSVGTMKGMKKLEDAIKAQLRSNKAYPCPVIQFESDKYKHPEYSWIQNPIFTVVDWATLQGDLYSQAEGQDEQPVSPEPPKATPAAAAKPALVKKPSLKAAAEPAEEPDTVTPIRGSRRRPPAA